MARGLSIGVIAGLAAILAAAGVLPLPAAAREAARQAQAGPPRQPPAASPPAAQAPAPSREQAAPAQPQRTEIVTQDNWTVTCREFAGSPPRRVCSATLQVVQTGSNQVLFAWTIGSNEDNKLVSVLEMPPGVLIAPGVELKLARGNVRKAPFLSCEATQCDASIVMDDAFIRDAAATETAEATVYGTDGQGLQFNIPLKGFDKALAGLRR